MCGHQLSLNRRDHCLSRQQDLKISRPDAPLCGNTTKILEEKALKSQKRKQDCLLFPTYLQSQNLTCPESEITERKSNKEAKSTALSSSLLKAGKLVRTDQTHRYYPQSVKEQYLPDQPVWRGMSRGYMDSHQLLHDAAVSSSLEGRKWTEIWLYRQHQIFENIFTS